MNTSNEYLKTLLNPAQFISDIPDDIMIRHVNRAETITYNLKSGASGSGLIVIYPNTPSSISGFHYRWDNTSSTWVFDQYIYTAQELKDSYDYGRLISGSMSIKSSTLPAGVYALNGTFNAVWFQGTLSEVSDYSYDRILSITSNPLDKVGNVLVGDGIEVLSLPQGFNNPYVRLGDKSPSTLLSPTHITNTSQNLGYGGAYKIPTTTVAGQATFQKEFSINVDSVGPIDIMWSGQMAMQDEWTVTANYQPLNISGTLIAGSMKQLIWSNTGVSNGNHYMNMNELNVSLFHENPPPEPVAAIKVNITYGNNTNGDSSFSVDSSFTINVIGGATIGVNSPTVVIGYQAVAEGTAITISGINNYELVPNPDLQKNLPMSYGKCDPQDLNYIKYILSNREKLGLRSVMTLAEYNRMKMYMHVLTNYNVDEKEAASFDFWNLLKQIKNVAVPLAATLAPQYAPIIGAADGLANAVLGNSASGKPVGNSASGMPISLSRRLRNAYSADSPLGEDHWNPNDSEEFNKLDIIYDVSHSSMALFPVIMMEHDQVIPSDPEELFIAVSLSDSLRKQIPNLDSMPYYEMGGHRIYNAVTQGPQSNNFLISDYILLPCYQLLDGKLASSTSPNKVTGSSHQLAIYAADDLLKNGTLGKAPFAAFTGSVVGSSVGEVFGINLKLHLTDSLGIPLLGNSPGLVPVKTLKELDKKVKNMGDVKRRTPKLTLPHWTAGSSSNPFRNTNPFLEDEDPPIQGNVAKTISEETKNLFLLDGQTIPSSQEKISTIHEYILEHKELEEAMFSLISQGKGRSLINMVVKSALNIDSQSREVTEERRLKLERKIKNLENQGIYVDESKILSSGKISKEDTDQALRKAKKNQKITKLRRIYGNNASIQGQYTEEDFVDFWMDKEEMPTGIQISMWLRGEDWTQPPPPRVVKRHYDSYILMLGPNPDQDLVDAVTELVDDVYDRNQGKGPTQEQARELSHAVRRLVTHTLVNKPRTAPRPPPRRVVSDQTAQTVPSGRRAALERLRGVRGEDDDIV